MDKEIKNDDLKRATDHDEEKNAEEKIYIAHSTDGGEIQTVKEHCENTSKLAGDFAISALKPVCRYMGALHDAGKYQKSFQKRIRGARIRVDHSICGAKICREQLGDREALPLLIQLCVAGHHTGIPDCTSDGGGESALSDRIIKETEDYSDFYKDISLPDVSITDFNKFISPNCKTREELTERFAFLVRYCFSCLTDADSLDTACFMKKKTERSLSADLAGCLEAVKERLASFTAVTELQKARARLQAQVFSHMGDKGDIYLMNMPTGSGKTLCSVRVALEKALASGKKRIIYIIPYNSIIDQTAKELEGMFGDKAQILRHQSTFSIDDKADVEEDYKETYKFACENWDAGIIVTTAVQFFESVYDNKRGRLRKLHNMADSILVFDEAHLMPIDFLQPCLRAVTHITRFLGSEAVFLTATMPDYRRLINEYAANDIGIIDLVPDKRDFAYFKKCRYTFLGAKDDEDIIKRAKSFPSALIIVNSRRGALELYKKCTGRKFHLSTYMTSIDRMKTIDAIKAELKALRDEFPSGEVPPEKRITVISTSLIEAGVDLDFHAVFRELNGLDSILQAGGRCNREGLLSIADVFVFIRSEGKAPTDERTMVTRGIIDEFDDMSSDEAVAAYYERLYYAKRDSITKNSLGQICSQLNLIPFAQYSLRLIDSRMESIVVPTDEKSRQLVGEIRTSGMAKPRLLQKYCASVYPNEFDGLLKAHAIDDFGSGVYCLINNDYYDRETGIHTEG